MRSYPVYSRLIEQRETHVGLLLRGGSLLDLLLLLLLGGLLLGILSVTALLASLEKNYIISTDN